MRYLAVTSIFNIARHLDRPAINSLQPSKAIAITQMPTPMNMARVSLFACRSSKKPIILLFHLDSPDTYNDSSNSIFSIVHVLCAHKRHFMCTIFVNGTK